MRLSHLSEALFCHLYLSQRPSASGACRRILVVTYDAIGDMVMSTPVLEALRKAFPGHALDVLCSPRNAVIIRHCDFVSEVFELNLNSGKSWREWRCLSALRRRGYERVINLFDEAGALALAKIASLAAQVDSLPIGYKNARQQKMLSRLGKRFRFSQETDAHVFTRRLFGILRLYAQPVPNDFVYRLCLPEDWREEAVQRLGLTARGGILFNPVGSRRDNSLSPGMITELLEQLLSCYARVWVFPFGSMGRILAEQPRLAGHPALMVVHDQGILDVAVTLQYVDEVLSTDTALVHMAVACDKPVTIIKPRGEWDRRFDPPYGDVAIVAAEARDWLGGFNSGEVCRHLRGAGKK